MLNGGIFGGEKKMHKLVENHTKRFFGAIKKKKTNRLTFIGHLTYKKEYHGEDHGFICVKYLKYLAVRVKQ